jgi:hypothetical protein
MLHKCANPSCLRAFRSLSHGKLFLIEIDHVSTDAISKIATATRKERTARRMERYWLCDECSSLLTLTFQRGRGMVTVPLPVRNTLRPALHLTHLQAGAVRAGSKHCRAELKGAL